MAELYTSLLELLIEIPESSSYLKAQGLLPGMFDNESTINGKKVHRQIVAQKTPGCTTIWDLEERKINFQ